MEEGSLENNFRLSAPHKDVHSRSPLVSLESQIGWGKFWKNFVIFYSESDSTASNVCDEIVHVFGFNIKI